MKKSNVVPTLKYLWTTTRHKWFVFVGGVRTKASIWRLLCHDLSKYGPSEAPHYGRQFYGDKSDPGGFARAWLHHQNHNPHHWEYWIQRTGHDKLDKSSETMSLPMPEWAVREMLADWLGASRAYNGEWPERLSSWKWFSDNYEKKIVPRLHPDTKSLVDDILAEVFGRE